MSKNFGVPLYGWTDSKGKVGHGSTYSVSIGQPYNKEGQPILSKPIGFDPKRIKK